MESPSPERLSVDKSCRSETRFNLFPDTICITILGLRRLLGFLKLFDTHHQRGRGRPRLPGSTGRERADGPQARRQVLKAARSDWDRSEAICSRQGSTEAPGSPDRRATFRSEPHARQQHRARHCTENPPGAAEPSGERSVSRSGEHGGRAERPPGAERRSERPSSPDRSAGANRGPHEVDRPAAGACARPGRPSAYPDRREGSLTAVSHTRRPGR